MSYKTGPGGQGDIKGRKDCKRERGRGFDHVKKVFASKKNLEGKEETANKGKAKGR